MRWRKFLFHFYAPGLLHFVGAVWRAGHPARVALSQHSFLPGGPSSFSRPPRLLFSPLAAPASSALFHSTFRSAYCFLGSPPAQRWAILPFWRLCSPPRCFGWPAAPARVPWVFAPRWAFKVLCPPLPSMLFQGATRHCLLRRAWPCILTPCSRCMPPFAWHVSHSSTHSFLCFWNFHRPDLWPFFLCFHLPRSWLL